MTHYDTVEAHRPSTLNPQLQCIVQSVSSLMVKTSVSSVVETPSRPYSPPARPGATKGTKRAINSSGFGVPAPVRRSFRAKADQPVETCIAPEFRLTKFNQIAADSTKYSLWDVQV